MSLNPPHISNEIVNRRSNSVSLTRKRSQYFFGREMVGTQNGFFQHISRLSQGGFAQYSWRNSHANNPSTSQTVPADVRRETYRVSPRPPVLLWIRSLDIDTDD